MPADSIIQLHVTINAGSGVTRVVGELTRMM